MLNRAGFKHWRTRKTVFSGRKKGPYANPDLVKADPDRDSALLSVPATRMAREMGRVVVANIITLGFLAAVSDIVTVDSLKQSVLSSVPKGTEEFNTKAFEAGYEYGLKYSNRGMVENG